MGKAHEVGIIGLGDLSDENDSHNETVDTKNTSHNNGDDTTHDQFRSHDTHGGHSDSGFCGTVGGTEVREDESGGGTGKAEEGGGGRARHFGVGCGGRKGGVWRDRLVREWGEGLEERIGENGSGVRGDRRAETGEG